MGTNELMVNDGLILCILCNKMKKVNEKKDVHDGKQDKQESAYSRHIYPAVGITDCGNKKKGVNDRTNVATKDNLLKAAADNGLQNTVAHFGCRLVKRYHHH